MEAYRLFEDAPGLEYAARYEYARGLLKNGRHAEARDQFKDLYTKTLAMGVLPRIDQSFRQALRGDSRETDQWTAWMQQTSARLIAAKRRASIPALAWQCWELGDRSLAERLLAGALDRMTREGEYLQTALAGIEYLIQTYQYAQADQLLQSLLARKALAQDAALWRLGAMIATQRGLPAHQRFYLEQMVEMEFRKLPEVIDLKALRNDLSLLLGHYQKMARAMATLEVEPPPDFLARVVRTADRWRSLEPEDPTACLTAAWIFQSLGANDLAWEYFTTPLSLQFTESKSWWDLANVLKEVGARELAEWAFQAVAEQEPTDALTLWLRAENLQEMGQTEAARHLFRRIADGPWPRGWESLQAQAREKLEGR
jgi:Tfp pilus assembly protein PilF